MKKILVVDDDQSILEALKIGIESEGHEVEATTQGEETMDIAKRFVPDVILLDLLLSGRDGREIAIDLKKNRQTKNIPIIMLSAHPSASKLAKESGIDDFIAKPFDFQELMGKINEHS